MIQQLTCVWMLYKCGPLSHSQWVCIAGAIQLYYCNCDWWHNMVWTKLGGVCRWPCFPGCITHTMILMHDPSDIHNSLIRHQHMHWLMYVCMVVCPTINNQSHVHATKYCGSVTINIHQVRICQNWSGPRDIYASIVLWLYQRVHFHFSWQCHELGSIDMAWTLICSSTFTQLGLTARVGASHRSSVLALD